MKNVRTKNNLLLTLPLLLVMPVAQADIGVHLNIDNENNRYIDPESDAIASLGIEYRGEKFNIDREAVSYDFVRSNSDKKKYAIEAILKSNNMSSEDIDADTLFNGMDKRKTSLDVGSRIVYKKGFAPVTVEMTRDVRASKGYEADVRVGGIEPHASHWNGKREVQFAALAGVKYQSDKVVDYHYGVKSSEATANRAAYKGKAATTPYVGFQSLFNINEKVSMNAGLVYERRDDSIKDSPLTDNKSGDTLFNLGVTYWF